MVERLSFGANEVGDFCVGLGGGAWVQFSAAEFCEWLLLCKTARKLDAFDNHAHVGVGGKIIGADRGRVERIRGFQRNRAAAFGSDERGAEAEAVVFARGEAVIDVVGGAEEELQIWSLRFFARAHKNSGFRYIGNERAALQDEIADEIGKRLGGGHAYRFRAEVTDGDHHVILEIFAYAGEVVNRVDSGAADFICWADSGEQKQLRGID